MVHRLPLPAHEEFGSVESGSPDGRYLIGGDENRSVLWHDHNVAVVRRGGSLLWAVNNHGTAVGNTGGRAPRPAVLHGTTMTPLRGVAHGSARGVNASGVIVGIRDDQHGRSTVVRWSSTAAKPDVLAGPRRYSSVDSVALTDGGTVVATVETETGHGQTPAWVTYVWPARGAAYRMPEPRVDGTLISLSVIGVNGESVTWRVVVEAKQPYWTFRYDLRTRTYQILPVTAYAEAVNLRGWVAGISSGPVNKLQLQTPDRTVDLTPGRTNSEARVVSDNGRIVAGYTWLGHNDATSSPVVWDCR